MNANYCADEHCKANHKLSVIVFSDYIPPPEAIHCRCTKGIGYTQPIKWKDAGEALNNPALAGCHMPDGPGSRVSDTGICLQYNEVRGILLILWSCCWPFFHLVHCLRLFPNPFEVSFDGKYGVMDTAEYIVAHHSWWSYTTLVLVLCINDFQHWFDRWISKLGEFLALHNQHGNFVLCSSSTEFSRRPSHLKLQTLGWPWASRVLWMGDWPWIDEQGLLLVINWGKSYSNTNSIGTAMYNWVPTFLSSYPGQHSLLWCFGGVVPIEAL
jgi:hypothetical protein